MCVCSKPLFCLSVYLREGEEEGGTLALLAFIWMCDLFNMLSIGGHRVFSLQQRFCENATEWQPIMGE